MGTCQFKRAETQDCIGNDVSHGIKATAICNCFVTDEERGRICRRFYRESELSTIKPESFCCTQLEILFHQCAEDSGFMAGAYDLRIYPNDGKEVWRNYVRLRFAFCPFCGTKLGLG